MLSLPGQFLEKKQPIKRILGHMLVSVFCTIHRNSVITSWSSNNRHLLQKKKKKNIKKKASFQSAVIGSFPCGLTQQTAKFYSNSWGCCRSPTDVAVFTVLLSGQEQIRSSSKIVFFFPFVVFFVF